ncbi:MAG: FtsX-like permease family protein, partial [Bacteroidetes bacterium]|nr:FtsX-like permease family protein [Bacteroidota bacterium]
MFKTDLTLALRSLRRRVRYALTNGLGLTLGLACALLVALYLGHELRFDAFHPEAERVHRLYKEIEGRTDRYALENPFLGGELEDGVAPIAAHTALSPNFRPAFVEVGSRRFQQDRKTVFYLKAGDAFFDVFGGFEMLQGDPASALAQPDRAILTDATARRYFGPDYGTLLGETLHVGDATLTVSGVVRVPTRSHLQFDILQSYAEHAGSNATHYTYLKLTPGTRPDAVRTQIDATYATVYGQLERGFPPERVSYGLERLTDIHLHTTVSRPITTPTDVRYLWAFGLLGVIVLLVAGVNYTNLAVVMGADRSAEVGARKALGALPQQITKQLLVESVLMAVLCAPVALGAVAALQPAFNQLMGTQIANPLGTPWAWAAVVGLALLVGLGAGLYPAFVMARTSTTDLFDGSAFARTGGISVRHGLIAVQFGVLIALVSGAVLVNQQLRFIQTKDLGFEREHVLQITNGNALAEQDEEGTWRSPKYTQLRQRLLQRSDVQGVSTLTRAPGEFWYEQTFHPVGDTSRMIQAPVLRTDPYIFETLGIEPAGGSYFERAPADRPSQALLLSTAFVREVGTPEGTLPDAILSGSQRVGVSGAFESINFFSLRQEAGPLVIIPQENVAYPSRVLIRTAPGALSATVDAVEQIWDELAPNTPLQYTFLDDQVAQLYAQDRRFAALSLGLAGLAGVLAVLGLTAVAAYMARLRVKEIGIRKALGASLSSILVLLNREFVALVGVALVVGAPLAWWGVEVWLGGFAYRID